MARVWWDVLTWLMGAGNKKWECVHPALDKLLCEERGYPVGRHGMSVIIIPEGLFAGQMVRRGRCIGGGV